LVNSIKESLANTVLTPWHGGPICCANRWCRFSIRRRVKARHHDCLFPFYSAAQHRKTYIKNENSYTTYLLINFYLDNSRYRSFFPGPGHFFVFLFIFFRSEPFFLFTSQFFFSFIHFFWFHFIFFCFRPFFPITHHQLCWKRFNMLKNNLPVLNVTKLSILSNHNADSRATHPASSILLKSLEEAPLSRGELRKALSACGSIRSTEPLNSSLERYWRRVPSSLGVVPSREGGLLRASSLKISRSCRGVSASAAKCLTIENQFLKISI
jgi:hypothetical protein